jgi:hypothetical protein
MNRLLSTVLFTFGIALAGCSNIDNAKNCEQICDKYKSCFDSSYDTSSCYDRCRSNSDDKNFESTVSACDSCIGDKSCAGATFACGSECSGVVP